GRRRGACPPDDVVVRASERGYGEAGLPLTSRVPYGGLTHHRLRPSSSWGCTLQTARCLHVAPGENGDWYGWRTGGTALTLGRVGPRPCPAGPRSATASVGPPTRCPAPAGRGDTGSLRQEARGGQGEEAVTGATVLADLPAERDRADHRHRPAARSGHRLHPGAADRGRGAHGRTGRHARCQRPAAAGRPRPAGPPHPCHDHHRPAPPRDRKSVV